MTYSETRQRFESRCAAILPSVLHSSCILAEISDVYPEIHLATRDLVCDLDSHESIVAKVDALSDHDVTEFVLSYVADAIVSEVHDHDDASFQMTQRDADEIMSLAYKIDPTASDVAAKIRDAIRDNIENVSV